MHCESPQNPDLAQLATKLKVCQQPTGLLCIFAYIN